MAKFDLSNIPKVFHNGTEAPGVYLNGVLAWTSESGGGGGGSGEQVIYENAAWAYIATGDEVILVFEKRDDLTYWAVQNDELTNYGPRIKQVNIEGSITNNAIIINPSENLNWIINVESGAYLFQKKDSDNYLCANGSNATKVSIDGTSSSSRSRWSYDGNYLINKFNSRYLFANNIDLDIKLAKTLNSSVESFGKVYIFKRVYE
jgi:hypothetical protein